MYKINFKILKVNVSIEIFIFKSKVNMNLSYFCQSNNNYYKLLYQKVQQIMRLFIFEIK